MDYGRFGLPDFHAVPRRDYLLAILSGVLLALSFPKAGLSLLAWISLVPLLLATSKKTPKKAFKLGFVAGMTAYCGILYWVNIVMTTYGKLPLTASVVLWLLLSAYLGLFPAIVAGLVRRGEERGVTPLLTLPLIWTALEYLRSFLMTGFPWALLGYSQYRMLPLIQIADITGVYGITFLIALANVLAYQLIRGAVVKDMVGYPVKTICVFVILIAATVSYGYKRLHDTYDGKQIKVALVQGNIDQNIKWDPAFQDATVKVYERLSRRACTTGADLVVWPESAIPFYFQDDLLYAERLRKLARETKSCVLFGSPAYEKTADRVRYLNSAFLLSPTGELVGRGDKMHLVPFGEYVPLARFLPFVHKLVAGIGDFSAGERVVTLKTLHGDLGALICFEGIFPELAREYVKAGTGLLVSITNDAWFGKSSAPYQHLSMTAFRAVENRVPLVRAANTGISAIIDPTGRIVKTTPLFEEATLTGDVKIRRGETLYNRFGDLFALAATAGAIMIIILMSVRKPPVFRRK